MKESGKSKNNSPEKKEESMLLDKLKIQNQDILIIIIKDLKFEI